MDHYKVELSTWHNGLHIGILGFYCFIFKYLDQLGSTTSIGTFSPQWCQNRECVYSGRAPPAPDSCIYGDYEGLLESGLRCTDIPVQQPWMCYEPRYQEMCCQTCDSIRNPDRPGNNMTPCTEYVQTSLTLFQPASQKRKNAFISSVQSLSIIDDC